MAPRIKSTGAPLNIHPVYTTNPPESLVTPVSPSWFLFIYLILKIKII